MQFRLIYVPAQHLKAPTAYGLKDFSIVSVKTKDGLTLKAWYRPAQPHKPTLLFLHGHAGHIGDRADTVQPYLNEGLGVFLKEHNNIDSIWMANVVTDFLRKNQVCAYS